MPRRSLLPAVATAAAAAAVTLPIATGGAQATGRTLHVTFGSAQKTFIDDVAPKSPNGPPKVSLGDRIVEIQSVTVDGRPGTLHTDAVVTNRTPSPFSHFTALLHLTVHLADGDLYGTGFVDSAGAGDRSEIVGGSGPYANARGTVVGSDKNAVITLLP